MPHNKIIPEFNGSETELTKYLVNNPKITELIYNGEFVLISKHKENEQNRDYGIN